MFGTVELPDPDYNESWNTGVGTRIKRSLDDAIHTFHPKSYTNTVLLHFNVIDRAKFEELVTFIETTRDATFSVQGIGNECKFLGDTIEFVEKNYNCTYSFEVQLGVYFHET